MGHSTLSFPERNRLCNLNGQVLIFWEDYFVLERLRPLFPEFVFTAYVLHFKWISRSFQVLRELQFLRGIACFLQQCGNAVVITVSYSTEDQFPNCRQEKREKRVTSFYGKRENP
ncbi:hypothetical protein CEXT_324971 [Caerostris extrusa]|uniref:Uncharacterized protein n=1 Tax=Caerostris extrusa TaxID=172846 RepID=A0AAV4V4A7_CAEEX|nr:hypothetical protein CEXT_324971 [Caerostris extrusa]